MVPANETAARITVQFPSTRKISIMERLDEFSKLLAESLSRRESLRRLGTFVAGALLAPWALGTAWAAGPDRCKAFCRGCSNKAQRDQCLAACRACNGNTSRLCGTCGAYVCCTTSAACCNGVCTNVKSDSHNCGACGNVCPASTPTCNQGVCVSTGCAAGLTSCGGVCVNTSYDSLNCGACGNVCPASAPFCNQGTCSTNSGNCPPDADFNWDAANCGACGHACQPLEHCSWGVCEGSCIGCE
jgi:hypothetical protein